MFKKILIVALVAMSSVSVIASGDGWTVSAANLEFQKPVELNSYQEALMNCRAGAPFAFFKAGLTQEEIELLESVKVQEKRSYSRFGDLDSLEPELVSVFQSMGNTKDTAEKAAQTVAKFVADTVKASGQETAWVVLRARKPKSKYKIPRWHVDGNYYQPYGQNVPKCVLTLKGPQTLFYPATLAQEAELESRRTAAVRASVDVDAVACRSDIASMFDESKILRPARGEGAVFNVGLDTRSGVHSEPDISEERIFLALVLGSNKQIMELKARFSLFEPAVSGLEQSAAAAPKVVYKRGNTVFSYVKGEMPKAPGFTIVVNPEKYLKVSGSFIKPINKLQELGIDPLTRFCEALKARIPASALFVFEGAADKYFGIDVTFEGAKVSVMMYGQDGKVSMPLFQLARTCVEQPSWLFVSGLRSMVVSGGVMLGGVLVLPPLIYLLQSVYREIHLRGEKRFLGVCILGILSFFAGITMLDPYPHLEN